MKIFIYKYCFLNILITYNKHQYLLVLKPPLFA